MKDTDFLSTIPDAFLDLVAAVRETYPVEDVAQVKPGTIAEALMIVLDARGWSLTRSVPGTAA